RDTVADERGRHRRRIEIEDLFARCQRFPQRLRRGGLLPEAPEREAHRLDRPGRPVDLVRAWRFLFAGVSGSDHAFQDVATFWAHALLHALRTSCSISELTLSIDSTPRS